ncbi:MAG: hypothetical protein IJ629_03955 [Clostridia bacterium]|nr:hypothetical protein [Clostridia bacterium]
MLTNVLVLGILCVAVFFIAREEKTNLHNWLYKDRTPLKRNLMTVYDFWRKVCKKPIRIAALVVIFICQKSAWGMLFSIVVLLGITYYLAAKFEVLQKINWEVEETQKVATLAAVALALCWLIDKLSLLKVLYNIVVIGALVIAICVGIYLFREAIKEKNKKREPDVIEFDDEDDIDDPADSDSGDDSDDVE